MLVRAFLMPILLLAVSLMWAEYGSRGRLNPFSLRFEISSLRSVKQSIDDCYLELNSAQFLTSAAHIYEATLRRCTNVTEEVVRRFPTYSYGWLASALVANIKNDFAVEQMSLRRSFETGGVESWVAKLRAEFFFQRNESIITNSDFRSEVNRDIETLIRSNREWQSVAKYFARENMRARITAIVRGLPVDNQNRFVAAMKSHLE